MTMKLVTPTLELLPSYKTALERGWVPHSMRPESRDEELAEIAQDAHGFVARMDNRRNDQPDITLPDGSRAKRLTGYARWIWDGEFCGDINLRWQHNTASLPEYCLGHIGYTVVPWKQRLGYATQALAQLLAEAKTETTLPHVDLTTDHDNIASQKAILANGGLFIEKFDKPAAYGGKASHLYRIRLR